MLESSGGAQVLPGVVAKDLIGHGGKDTIMKSRKHLTRFTYDTTDFKGWRVAYTRAGETFVKYFSDKKYGTGKKSLAAAEEFLEKLKEILSPIPSQTNLRKAGAGAGQVGVHRTAPKEGGSGSAVWVATWSEDGKRKSRKFSVVRYGEREAKRLAVEARKRAEEVTGRNMSKVDIKARLRQARELVAKK
jgi:hypothetical protein